MRGRAVGSTEPTPTPGGLRLLDRALRLLAWCVWLLAIVHVSQSCLVAQHAASDGSYYSREPGFRIPFQADQGGQRIAQVQLYLSQDQGRSWQQVATAQPAERFFRFQARQDGWYWFAVRTVDLEGRGYPHTLDLLQPGLKVCVDTQRPVVHLRPLMPADGGAGVEWQVTDENLELDSLRLEHRPQGSTGEWISLNPPRTATGQRTWSPGTNAPLDVRLQVRDRAGNVGEAIVQVTPTTPAAGGLGNVHQPVQPPTPGSVRRVNSKRISLNYEIKEVGKSGVAIIELWYTRDLQGRTWQKHDERTNPQPPYIIEVTDEGLYGFTLVARSGVGLGEQPPRVGDQPQIWVEVDLTKPRTQLLNLDVGRGNETGNLTITWSASDKNLGPRPITLSYADRPEGPWTIIAAGEENTGRYVWRMPPEVPYQLYIRVEATDLAGNVGSSETPKPIAVDLSKPKVQVIGVEPGN